MHTESCKQEDKEKESGAGHEKQHQAGAVLSLPGQHFFRRLLNVRKGKD